MMKTTIQMVGEFHEAFDIAENSTPRKIRMTRGVREKMSELAEMQAEVAKWAHDYAKKEGKHAALLRVQLMTEELGELIEAMADGTIEEIASEAADMDIVLAGTVRVYGLAKCQQDVVSEIHRANMSKLEDGKPVKDAAGRVMKGRYFQKANVKGIVT